MFKNFILDLNEAKEELMALDPNWTQKGYSLTVNVFYCLQIVNFVWHEDFSLILLNLHDHFNIHVCLSAVCPILSCHVTLPIPTILSQHITNKSCWVCIRGEEYAFLVTPDPWGPWGQEKPSYIHYVIKKGAWHRQKPLGQPASPKSFNYCF